MDQTHLISYILWLSEQQISNNQITVGAVAPTCMLTELRSYAALRSL